MVVQVLWQILQVVGLLVAIVAGLAAIVAAVYGANRWIQARIEDQKRPLREENAQLRKALEQSAADTAKLRADTFNAFLHVYAQLGQLSGMVYNSLPAYFRLPGEEYHAEPAEQTVQRIFGDSHERAQQN